MKFLKSLFSKVVGSSSETNGQGLCPKCHQPRDKNPCSTCTARFLVTKESQQKPLPSTPPPPTPPPRNPRRRDARSKPPPDLNKPLPPLPLFSGEEGRSQRRDVNRRADQYQGQGSSRKRTNPDLPPPDKPLLSRKRIDPSFPPPSQPPPNKPLPPLPRREESRTQRREAPPKTDKAQGSSSKQTKKFVLPNLADVEAGVRLLEGQSKFEDDVRAHREEYRRKRREGYPRTDKSQGSSCKQTKKFVLPNLADVEAGVGLQKGQGEVEDDVRGLLRDEEATESLRYFLPKEPSGMLPSYEKTLVLDKKKEKTMRRKRKP